MKISRDEDGFTLIELLVVIVIIGILAAIAVPNLIKNKARANDAATISDVSNIIAGAANTWNKEHPGWKGPYKSEIQGDVIDSDGSNWNILPTRDATGQVAYCIVAYNSKGVKYDSGAAGREKPVWYSSDAGGLSTEGNAPGGACSGVSKYTATPSNPTDAKALASGDKFRLSNTDRPNILNTGGGEPGNPEKSRVNTSVAYAAGFYPTPGVLNGFQSGYPKVTGAYTNKNFVLVNTKCATGTNPNEQSATKCGDLNVFIDGNTGLVQFQKGANTPAFSYQVKVTDDSTLASTTPVATQTATSGVITFATP